MENTEELLELGQDEIYAMSFENALEKLEIVVDLLEKGSVSLDDAIGLYELGTKLRKHCDHTLQKAQDRINVISLENPDTENA